MGHTDVFPDITKGWIDDERMASGNIFPYYHLLLDSGVQYGYIVIILDAQTRKELGCKTPTCIRKSCNVCY